MNNNNYTFLTELPSGITPKLEVSGCFCFFEGKFLLLKRQESKPQGGTWCLPAGKKESEETPIETAIREVYEETGLKLIPAEMEKVGSYYIKHDQGDLVFHTFSHKLLQFPELTVDATEHIEHKWVNFTDLDDLELIIAGREVLDLCQPRLIV